MPFSKLVFSHFLFFFFQQLSIQGQNKKTITMDNESLYRPNFHFTPAQGWMNDPNGMIFLNGQY